MILFFVTVVVQPSIVGTMGSSVQNVGGFILPGLDESYMIDTTTTFEAIMEDISNYFTNGDIDFMDWLYDASYGIGCWYSGSGETNYHWMAGRRTSYQTLETFSDRKMQNLDLVFSVFFHPGTGTAQEVGIVTDDGYCIKFRLQKNGATPAIYFSIGTVNTATTTWISAYNISTWTTTSSGWLLEVNIQLCIMKVGSSINITPVLTIHNKADGQTYVWDSLADAYGTGATLVWLLTDEFGWYCAQNVYSFTVTHLTVMKVTIR